MDGPQRSWSAWRLAGRLASGAVAAGWVIAVLGAKVAEAGEEEPPRCDFPVVDARTLSPLEFQARFVSKSIPVLITHALQGWPALEEWTWGNLKTAFEQVPLRVGPGPYPETTMSIAAYLELADAAHREGGAEVPGVFQYGQVPTSWSLWAHKDACVPMVAYLHPNSIPIHPNISQACELLSKVRVPSFLVGDETVAVPPNAITHSGVLIGYKNSGIDFHKHQAAINVIFDGEKEWVMKVASATVERMERLPAEQARATRKEDFYCSRNPKVDVCFSQRMQQRVIEKLKARAASHDTKFQVPAARTPRERDEYHLGSFARWIATEQVTEELEDSTEVLHCVQRAGEIVFIPQDTQHGVLNLKNTVAMQMQWDATYFGNPHLRTALYRYLLNALDPEEPDPDFDRSVSPLGAAAALAERTKGRVEAVLASAPRDRIPGLEARHGAAASKGLYEREEIL